MPLLFSKYLFPENLIALGVVTFLIGFFSIWFIGLVIYWRWLRTERKRIENNQNIQPLVKAQQERDRGHEGNDQKIDPENAFTEFCPEGSLDKRSPITKHLKAIFVAGWDDSRLEVGELINHTTSELFKWNNLFRSMLAVFIVIGLLGTLFGLADSLTGLSPALRESVASESTIENDEKRAANQPPTENGKKMAQALSELLGNMKGALAPSIWGIIFTIIGVILYGIYLQLACHPVKSILERSTLTVWIPKLYPTTSQKLIQTLQQSKSQMQKGFETAAQFSDSVKKVHGNIDEFNESLTQASTITQPLSDSVTQINKAALDISTAADVLNTGFAENLDKFSEEFTSSVTHLTGFQDEIRNLHQEFQEAANQKLNQQTEKLDDQNENIAQVIEVIDRILNALKSYETTYINSREEISKELQEFISKATETNTSIYEENREWFEDINDANKQQFSEMQSQLKTEIGDIQQTLKNQLDDLTTRLVKNLENVQQDLDSGLTTLNERLENFDTPLKETVEEIKGVFDERLTTLNEGLEKFHEPIQKSANQISGTFRNLVNQMQEIVGNLQREIKEQNESYEDQLTGVKSLNERVVSLLNQLDESSTNQKDAVNALSSNINGLTEDTKHLATAIESFTSDSGILNQSIAAIEEHTETLGTASQQFVEKVEKADVNPLTANIERLNTAVNEISQNSRTLANAVDRLARQMQASETERPDRTQKKRSFFGRINPFSRTKSSGQATSESQNDNEDEVT